MTTFLLIRHGDTDAVGRTITGWMPGIHLNARGRAQVEALAAKLERLAIRAVYSSPLERALETAGPVAKRHSLSPQRVEDLGEVRFGGWEGLAIEELVRRDDWQRYNAFRSSVGAPGGEFMIEVQSRMVRRIDDLARLHPGELIAAVSHGDPIRSAIVHYLGMPLDFLTRFDISPASVSVLELGDRSARMLCINQTGDLPL